MRQVEDDEEEDTDGTVLELSRFACISTLPSSRPSSHNPPRPGPSRPPDVVKREPPDHLVDSQLVRLSKCIGCELRWTSKKSVKQKRMHVEQCAKKNALTKDTVRILIEKEVVSLSPTQNIAPADKTDGIATATLMESVIPTYPAKKFKRRQVVPTVRSLPETRESIMDRAREILGLPGGQEDTQPARFGQSPLVCQSAHHPKSLALSSVNRYLEEPPPTQPFGVSSLQGGVTAWSVGDCDKSCCVQAPQSGGSMFNQVSVLSSDRPKRPASPPTPGSNSRTVRRRLLQ